MHDGRASSHQALNPPWTGIPRRGGPGAGAGAGAVPGPRVHGERARPVLTLRSSPAQSEGLQTVQAQAKHFAPAVCKDASPPPIRPWRPAPTLRSSPALRGYPPTMTATSTSLDAAATSTKQCTPDVSMVRGGVCGCWREAGWVGVGAGEGACKGMCGWHKFWAYGLGFGGTESCVRTQVQRWGTGIQGRQ